MRAHDAFHARRNHLHPAHNGRQIRMRRQHQLGAPSCRPHRRGRKACLAPRRSSEHKLALPNVHAVQFLRVVQAQESIFHSVRSGIFAQDESEMPAGSLDSAGSIQFREQSNNHALSVTKLQALTQGPRHSHPHCFPFANSTSSVKRSIY